ncbi:MAG: RNA pseudouridine synthase [Verrucomicrobiota bacterium]
MIPSEWRALPWCRGVRVASSGVDWVVVEKPEGVLSHPNEEGDRSRSVLCLPYQPDKEEFTVTSELSLRLCHRLDGPTSGLLTLATGEKANWFRRAWEEGRVKKDYWAIVVGRPRDREFSWTDRLVKKRVSGKIRVEVGASGIAAETRGREITFSRNALPLTLLQLQPRTGRTHQLRVQAAAHRLPILGDRQYGDFRANRLFRQKSRGSRLFLHASRLQWKEGGRVMKVGSAIPQEFVDCFPGTARIRDLQSVKA